MHLSSVNMNFYTGYSCNFCANSRHFHAFLHDCMSLLKSSRTILLFQQFLCITFRMNIEFKEGIFVFCSTKNPGAHQMHPEPVFHSSSVFRTERQVAFLHAANAESGRIRHGNILLREHRAAQHGILGAEHRPVKVDLRDDSARTPDARRRSRKSSPPACSRSCTARRTPRPRTRFAAPDTGRRTSSA